MGNRSLSAVTDRTSTTVSQGYQQQATTQATVRTPTVVTHPVSSSGGTTVLHQTILTNKPAGITSHSAVAATLTTQAMPSTSTPAIVAQPVTPTVVVPVDPHLVTLANIGSTVTVATTPAPEPTITRTNGSDSNVTASNVTVTSGSPEPDLSDLQATAPDPTRTYAMRPRKTN